MNDKKAPVSPVRRWRMTADMPQGGFVDSVPAATAEPTGAELPLGSARVIAPARVPSWRASSHDLLTGASATEVVDTIPGDLFDELFGDGR